MKFHSSILLFTFIAACILPATEGPPPAPDEDTLLLTWQRDPSTTMTVQWLEPGHEPALAADQKIKPKLPVSIPRIGILPLSEWPEDGVLEVETFATMDYLRHDAEVFSAQMRMGWNEEGLMVWVRVQDPSPVESANDERLWEGDSVMSFVSTGVGSEERIQTLLAPGRDPQKNEPRFGTRDHRSGEDLAEISVDFAVTPSEDGYLVGFRYPWEILGLDARPGTTLAYQIHLYSFSEHGGDRRFLGWLPTNMTHADPALVMPLELVEEVPPPRHLEVGLEDSQARIQIIVYGGPELAGQEVSFRAGQKQLGETTLDREGHAAIATFEVPREISGKRLGSITVNAGDRLLDYVTVDPVYLKTPRNHTHELEYWVNGSEERVRVTADRHAMVAWRATTRHRVELEDLQPDTLYRFRINESGRTFAFRTMPQTLSRPLVVAVGGDTRHRKDWMLATNRQAMAYDPDFVIWGGDFAYADGREDRLYRWDEWFEANAEGLVGEDGRIVPIVAAIGNHEVPRGYADNHPDFDDSDAWRLATGPYFYQLFAFPGLPGYASLDFGEYLSLVILDTGHANLIPGRQTDWLEKVLGERTGQRHVMPVYHVPAFPSHRSYEGRISRLVREHWIPLFDARDNIKVAFENHDHTYKRTPPIRGLEVSPDDGIVYVGDGAWGVHTRTVHDPETTWYLEHAEGTRHAIIMTIHPDTLDFEVVSEDGEIIDRFSLGGDRE